MHSEIIRQEGEDVKETATIRLQDLKIRNIRKVDTSRGASSKMETT